MMSSCPRHTTKVCPYFKMKREIEAEEGVSVKKPTEVTIGFSAEQPDGFDIEEGNANVHDEDADSENSSTSDESTGELSKVDEAEKKPSADGEN